MKKSYLFLLLILSLFFESCSDDFNINAPQQDIYVLNCILRNNQTIQYAIISKNIFTENGNSPASNSILQNIKGAEIKIFYNDSVFIMRDTTILLSDSGNVSEINCYYVENLKINSGKVIRIEASVPGGQTLTSVIQGVENTFSKVSLSFPPYFDPLSEFPRYDYGWIWKNNSGAVINVFNLPEIEIYYKKYEGGKLVDGRIFVPLANSFTQNDDGSFQSNNVEKLSYISSCSVTPEIINNTMLKISGDDPDKQNYIINKVIFRIIGLDANLTKYYFAYNTYREGFSIKLRQTDYSNIDGGKGIFGAYYKFSQSLIIDSSYIHSFGYQFDPN